MVMAQTWRRLAVTVASAAALALAGCGGGTPEEPDGGAGQLGTGPSDSPSQSTDPAATPGGGGGGGSNGGGGGGGGGDASPYPSSAKDYGLALLRAIDDNDQTRIVDLADVNTYQWAISQHNYQDRNGEWTYSHCDSGATQSCFYYNVPGDFAHVLVDTGRLGQNHAVSAVTIEGGMFPTDAGNYVQSFIGHWIDDRRVGMNAYATNGVLSFIKGAPKPQGGFIQQPTPCGSGRQCVVAGEFLAGGQPAGNLIRFVVQTDRLGAADAIIEASTVA